jgi:hypothetical protein
VWPISVQCRVLEVSVAGYHAHVVRAASTAQRRHLSDAALLVPIQAIHAETRGSYGWPRTCKELLARGIRVGKERVQKLMQRHGIRARGKRRLKVTTDSHHDFPIAPNLLERQFTVAEPDKVWAGDITYIATDEGGLFLAVVIDLFSRQVIGWSLRADMTRDIVIDALRMAWFKRHPSKKAGLIFHSNRGSQYAAKDLRDVLAEYGTTSSMSRKGNCWDCQPDAVRRKLVRQPTPARQCMSRLWDTNSKGKVSLVRQRTDEWMTSAYLSDPPIRPEPVCRGILQRLVNRALPMYRQWRLLFD